MHFLEEAGVRYAYVNFDDERQAKLRAEIDEIINDLEA